MHVESHVVTLTTDADGDAVLGPIVVADRIKIAVASGGDTKFGTFHVLLGG